ncbi:MAG: alcohol dehydrogenase catalytic domain-containing protein [Nitrososphaera sp.]
MSRLGALKSRAAVFYGPGDIAVEQRDFPEFHDPSARGARLRIRCCSVCGYDARVLKSGHRKVNPPVVLGHEICGETIHDVDSITSGTRVAVYPVAPCLHCSYCKMERYNLCSNLKEIGSSIDGGFSEFLAIPKEIISIGGLVPTPDSMTDSEASLVEPLACCVNSVSNVAAMRTRGRIDTVAIIGDGPMGMMHAMLTRRMLGAKTVVVLGRIPNRIAFGRSLGIQTHSVVDSPISDILQPCGDEGYDVVFVAASDPSALELARKIAAKGACISIFAGISGASAAIDPHFVHYSEVTVTGTFSSTPAHFRTAVELASRKDVDLSKLVTHTFPLESISEAFKATSDYRGMRISVRP